MGQLGDIGVGEALVSTLQQGGVPMPVERTMIASPGCRLGAISDEERAEIQRFLEETRDE